MHLIVFGIFQVVSSKTRDESSWATLWSTLRFLTTLAGNVAWFLAVIAAPVLGICMVLVLPVMILASTAHLGIDEWDDDVEQVPVHVYLERRPVIARV